MSVGGALVENSVSGEEDAPAVAGDIDSRGFTRFPTARLTNMDKDGSILAARASNFAIFDG